jgi:hypothetical protein
VVIEAKKRIFRISIILAVALAVGAALLYTSALGDQSAAGGSFSEARTATASCEEAIAGSGSSDWKRKSTVVGPFGLPARHLRLAYRSPSDGLLHSKLMALVVGHEPVTVSVPARLARRLGLEYGYRNGKKPATSVTFVPCPDKPRTYWPGGIVFKQHEPLALKVGDPDPVGLVHLGQIGNVPSTP